MDKRVYLVAIKLTNCQSFKDSIIKFATDRLNVFVADNSTGKSVFFRMLSITAFPNKCSREDRLNIIRRGSQFAQILYMFSDGSYGGVRVLPDRVIYYYTPNENTRMTQTVEPHPELIAKLGLILDNNSGFVANLIDMDQNLLLVNSNQKSDSNILQMLTGNETIDRMIESTSDKKKVFEQYEDRLKDVIYSYSKSIDGYEYTDTNALELNIEQCECMFDTLYKLLPIDEELVAFAANMTDYVDYDRLLSITNTLIQLEGLARELCSMQQPRKFNDKLLCYVQICIKAEQLRDSIANLHIPHCEKDSSNKLHTLLVIEGIIYDLDKCHKPEDLTDFTPTINTLQKLEQFDDYICEASIHLDNLAASQRTMSELYKMLGDLGEIISCGIYGEVIFDGEKCISVDK